MADIRTLIPGEFVQNPDGSKSTERTITVVHPLLNNGEPTNIPTIFKQGGKIIELDLDADDLEDQAVNLALETGQNFSSFKNIDDAVSAAINRSNKGGAFQGQFGVEIPRGPLDAKFE